MGFCFLLLGHAGEKLLPDFYCEMNAFGMHM